MKEIWKDIEDYEGLYQVSNLGRVKALTHKSWNGYKYWMKPGKILKQTLQTNKKYLFVTLSDGHNHSRKFRTHRLVAKAFVPNPKSLNQVNHLDENSLNNKANNLDWVSAKQNINYGHHKEKQLKTWYSKPENAIKSRKNGQKVSKPVIQLTLSGQFVKRWSSAKEAGRQLKISNSVIGDCCCHRRWCHTAGGYRWKFANDCG